MQDYLYLDEVCMDLNFLPAIEWDVSRKKKVTKPENRCGKERSIPKEIEIGLACMTQQCIGIGTGRGGG